MINWASETRSWKAARSSSSTQFTVCARRHNQNELLGEKVKYFDQRATVIYASWGYEAGRYDLAYRPDMFDGVEFYICVCTYALADRAA